jgi:hypothetical protein
MKLCELFESDSVKQDELRAKIRKLKAKSKNNNPKHEYDDVEGRTQKPQYVALGGHTTKGLSGVMND